MSNQQGSSYDTIENTIITVENNNTNDTNDNKKRKISKLWIVLIVILVLLLGVVIIFFSYFGSYYHATNNALKFMNSSKDVKVIEGKDAYVFDGPGSESALIFYQGAKVDEKAYAGILYELAKNGTDCYLVKMPKRFAIFGKNKASDIIEENKNTYKKWYIAGHSLGGAMAATYAAKNSDKINGLVLLAAYSTEKIPENVKVISIVGSNDKVLKWDTYNKNMSNLPSNKVEIVIKGGNHGQFGDYGAQKGDGNPEISVEQQHEQIVNGILQNL